jgi:hypothetical protein
MVLLVATVVTVFQVAVVGVLVLLEQEPTLVVTAVQV